MAERGRETRCRHSEETTAPYARSHGDSDGGEVMEQIERMFEEGLGGRGFGINQAKPACREKTRI